MIEYFKRIFKNTLIYGMGDMIVKAIAFILIPLYTRHLSPDEYGVVSLLQTVQMIMIVILGLGLNSAIFKVYNDAENEEEKNEIISTNLIFLFIWALPFTLIMLWSVKPLSMLIFGSPEEAVYLRILFISLMLDLFRLAALAVLRAREKPVHFSIINIINFSLLVGLNIINVAVRGRGILGIMESHLFTSSVICLSVFIVLFRRLQFRFSKRRIKELLAFGLPLVPSGVAAWSLSAMAQYFLRYYWGSSEVGLYGLGWRFGMVINMLLVHPFRTTWLPFMFSIQKEERARRVYALSLTYFVAVSMFVVLLLSVLAKEIVSVAATEGYLDAYKAIPLIAVAYLFYGMYYTVDVGVLLTGKTKYCVVITGIAAIVQLGLNFIFIPKYRMLGAAFSTAVSYFILFLLMYFTAQKQYPIKYEKMRLLKIVTAGVFIYTFSHLIQTDSIWLSVILKMSLITSFPLLLYVLRFFHQQEIDAVKARFRRFFYSKRR